MFSVSEMVGHLGALLMLMSLVKTGPVGGCVCPPATILSQFPSVVPADERKVADPHN